MHIRSLEHRVAILESIVLEGKHDQEILQNFLGDDYYNKYLGIKNKIHDAEYKDIYKVIKKDLDDVKDFIDSFQSNTSKIKSAKSGAELVYNKNGWKIYRITTPEAAMAYGRNTAWCIASTHEHMDQKYYFDHYISPSDVEKAYYFVIGEEEKWCVILKLDGSAESIWTDDDKDVTTKIFVKYCPVNDYFKFKVNFSSVSNYVMSLPYQNTDMPDPDDRERIEQAYENGVNSVPGWTCNYGVSWNKNTADSPFLSYMYLNHQQFQSYYKEGNLIVELIDKELDSLDDSILVSKPVNIYSLTAKDVSSLLVKMKNRLG